METIFDHRWNGRRWIFRRWRSATAAQCFGRAVSAVVAASCTIADTWNYRVRKVAANEKSQHSPATEQTIRRYPPRRDPGNYRSITQATYTGPMSTIMWCGRCCVRDRYDHSRHGSPSFAGDQSASVKPQLSFPRGIPRTHSKPLYRGLGKQSRAPDRRGRKDHDGRRTDSWFLRRWISVRRGGN